MFIFLKQKIILKNYIFYYQLNILINNFRLKNFKINFCNFKILKIVCILNIIFFNIFFKFLLKKKKKNLLRIDLLPLNYFFTSTFSSSYEISLTIFPLITISLDASIESTLFSSSFISTPQFSHSCLLVVGLSNMWAHH